MSPLVPLRVPSPAGNGLTLPRHAPPIGDKPLGEIAITVFALRQAHAMALWTPYADEALDLSKHDRDPRKIRDVAEYAYSAEEDRCYNYVYGYTVPASQISPVESWNRRVSSPPHSSDSFEIDSLSDDVEYQAFERDALRTMAEKNGGTLLGNNPRMRRAVQTNQAPDDSYRKQRERNNFAAKQSRDRRKLREVRLAFQVTFLKKKIADLRTRLGDRVCLRCQQQCRC